MPARITPPRTGSTTTGSISNCRHRGTPIPKITTTGGRTTITMFCHVQNSFPHHPAKPPTSTAQALINQKVKLLVRSLVIRTSTIMLYANGRAANNHTDFMPKSTSTQERVGDGRSASGRRRNLRLQERSRLVRLETARRTYPERKWSTAAGELGRPREPSFPIAGAGRRLTVPHRSRTRSPGHRGRCRTACGIPRQTFLAGTRSRTPRSAPHRICGAKS